MSHSRTGVRDRREAKTRAKLKNSMKFHVACSGAKRGARLPRPPLDPPSVRSAAFGSVSLPFEESASDPDDRALTGAPSRKKKKKDPLANLESDVG